jgi:hypothetical protein
LVSTSAAPSARSTRRLVATPLTKQRLRSARGAGTPPSSAAATAGGAAAAASGTSGCVVI